ncbi:hypothetical protein HLV40_05070 [Chromohalobacter salexigens]|uniref:Uncharacterized protein n=1 Tax=Chromohalobacter moromii TaxID=2860329 RepID=A0A9X2X1M4_9GAMM|nr:MULTISPECIES: hypothetical protein [Chromohalobacter]NWO09770.1 hypothetical protein [Chromohalobacter salexigens]CDQ34211.1 hypothetical protein BN993_03665 [Virgibacillus halodenitrificans]MCK2043216.1 hypothetical protein [Chromohalobacter moromii]MCK2046132.1 hypothetical protein [Chromohalobacter moromii]MCT8505444.1 hypothetical protein [Chromohalobacter moromii]
MKALNKLFSMLATIVVSALLPFSMVAESEANQNVSVHNDTANVSTLNAKQRQDDDPL